MGQAILDDKLYGATLDCELVALDIKSGQERWSAKVADYKPGYSMTMAPLAIRGKVVVGISGGEAGVRGFVDAYDSQTGRRAWRFWTIPGPGEPGHETWSGDAWKTGSGATWVTGSYDPELNLVYWGVGNPGPDWNGDSRPAPATTCTPAAWSRWTATPARCVGISNSLPTTHTIGIPRTCRYCSKPRFAAPDASWWRLRTETRSTTCWIESPANFWPGSLMRTKPGRRAWTIAAVR